MATYSKTSDGWSTIPGITIKVETREQIDRVDFDWQAIYDENDDYPTTRSAPWTFSGPSISRSGNASICGGGGVLASGTNTYYKEDYSSSLNFSMWMDFGPLGWSGFEGALSVSLSIPVSAANRASVPSISTSSQLYVPNGTIRIYWSGSTDHASGLYLTVKDSASNTLLSNQYISTSVSYYDLNLSNRVSRGGTVYASMYSKGDSDYLDSRPTSQVTVGKINNYPTKPKVSKNRDTIRGTDAIIYTVSGVSDADGQTVTTYYALNSSGWKEVIDNKVTITLNTPSLKEGTNTIYFKASDGLEDSYTTTDNFTAISKPEFDSGTPSLIYKAISSESSASLVKSGTLSFSLKSDLTNPKIDVKIVSSPSPINSPGSLPEKVIGEAYYTYSGWNRTKQVTIEFISLPTSILPYGSYFQLRLKVYGPGGASDVVQSGWLQQGRRPFQPKMPDISLITAKNDAVGSYSLPDYFKKKITVSMVNPVISSGYAPITKIQIAAIRKSGEKLYTNCDKDTSGRYEVVISNLADLPAGEKFSFGLQVTDKAGQIKFSNLNFTFIKTSLLAFLGKTVTINPKVLRPMSPDGLPNGDKFVFKFSPAKATGSSQISYVYTIGLPLSRPGNHTYILREADYSFSSEQDVLNTISIKGDTIRYILKHELTENAEERNNAYDQAYIEIKAYDSFNSIAVLKQNFIVNFSEAPIWPEKDLFLYHDYQIRQSAANQKYGPIKTYTPTSGDPDLNLRMFNSREGIVLGIPLASDANNDIVKYEVYLGKGDFRNMLDVSLEGARFEKVPWVTIPASSLGAADENGYCYYTHRASQYASNKFFYFKIVAVDSRGNSSAEKISNTFILGCRTMPTIFKTGETKIARNKSTVTVDYNLRIIDLGGSAIDNQWSLEYYNKYQNFEREIYATPEQLEKIYKPKIGLKIQIDSDPKFNTENLQTKFFVQQFDTGLAESQMINFTHSSTIFEGFDESVSKLYVRFQVITSYGLDTANIEGEFAGLSFVESLPQIASYLGAVPTVAHRSHTVGINTSNFISDDIAVIESYPGKRYVKLKGLNTITGENFEIKVDLFTGEVSGGKFSGGSW